LDRNYYFCEFYLPIIFLAASINQWQSVLFRPHQALRPQKDPMTYRRFATASFSDAPKIDNPIRGRDAASEKSQEGGDATNHAS